MDVLRTLTSALGALRHGRRGQLRRRRIVPQGGAADRRSSASLVAAMGRVEAGGGPVAPDPALSHAANFLYMLTGERPRPTAATAFDIALIAARGPRAERVDVRRARGRRDADGRAFGRRRRHRRAQGAAARRRQRRRHAACCSSSAPTPTPERVESAIRAQAGEQGEDPRLRPPRLPHRGSARDAPAPDVEGARRAKPASRAGTTMSERIEALVKGEKKLNPNVDFYSASTYYTLGIPIELFTPIFAVSRVSGWTAHVLEQLANNRLIRPRADYTGPAYPQGWLPLDRAIGDGARTRLSARPDGSVRYRSRRFAPGRHAPAMDPRTSGTSRSSPTSTTASRRWRTVSSRSPAPCRRARWRRRSSTAWTSSASAGSPSRRTPCA